MKKIPQFTSQEQEAEYLNRQARLTTVYKIVERYSDAGRRGQTVERTLCMNGETFASENVSADCKNSMLGGIVSSMEKAAGFDYSDKCLGCRYKVGNYTGDPAYMLYIIFKTRIRLKFVEFELRLRKFAIERLGLKLKPARIKKFHGLRRDDKGDIR